MLLGCTVLVWLVGPACAQTTTTTYAYDAQGQVAEVSRPSGQITYTYDAAANRTALTASTGQALGAVAARSSDSSASAAKAAAPADPLQDLVAAARAAAHVRQRPFTESTAVTPSVAYPSGVEKR